MYLFDYRSLAEAQEDFKMAEANMLNAQKSLVKDQYIRMVVAMKGNAIKHMRAVRKRDLGEFCLILLKFLLVFNSI